MVILVSYLLPIQQSSVNCDGIAFRLVEFVVQTHFWALYFKKPLKLFFLTQISLNEIKEKKIMKSSASNYVLRSFDCSVEGSALKHMVPRTSDLSSKQKFVIFDDFSHIPRLKTSKNPFNSLSQHKFSIFF